MADGFKREITLKDAETFFERLYNMVGKTFYANGAMHRIDYVEKGSVQFHNLDNDKYLGVKDSLELIRCILGGNDFCWVYTREDIREFYSFLWALGEGVPSGDANILVSTLEDGMSKKIRICSNELSEDGDGTLLCLTYCPAKINNILGELVYFYGLWEKRIKDKKGLHWVREDNLFTDFVGFVYNILITMEEKKKEFFFEGDL